MKGLQMHVNDILLLPDLQAIKARFENMFDRRAPDECWEWNRKAKIKGYGVITVHGSTVSAHRLSYALYKQPIPGTRRAGRRRLMIRHRCDNPACVNPNHLVIGRPKQNSADRMRGAKIYGYGEHNPSAKLTDTQVSAIRVDTRIRREIAVDYGVSVATIGRVQSRHSWRKNPSKTAARPRYPTGLRGQLNVRSKLSEQDVYGIRADARRQADVAEAYGVTIATVSHIRRRVTWKHLP